MAGRTYKTPPSVVVLYTLAMVATLLGIANTVFPRQVEVVLVNKCAVAED